MHRSHADIKAAVVESCLSPRLNLLFPTRVVAGELQAGHGAVQQSGAGAAPHLVGAHGRRCHRGTSSSLGGTSESWQLESL